MCTRLSLLVAFVIFAIFLVAMGNDTAEEDIAKDFNLTIKAKADNRGLKTRLEFELTYNGANVITVTGLDPQIAKNSIEIIAPVGWVSKQSCGLKLIGLNGYVSPTKTLKKGESIQFSANLAEFFSKFVPGKTKFEAKIKFPVTINTKGKIVVVKKQIEIPIIDEITTQPATTRPAYDFEVKPTLKESEVDGPCELQITVTYHGKEQVEIQGLDPTLIRHCLAFETPSGWESMWKGRVRLTSNNTITGTHILNRGDSVVNTVDLKEFFQKMLPGKTELRINLTLWQKKSDDSVIPFTLTTSTTVHLIKKANKAESKPG
jgi:hypothetical protein